ncbi:hypothetical protein [uncultured Kocuria sp.]|uniref:hypothetical protein n=1 Tax=uncultured Kocuria sp. TaxID=259305 RepID=UPI00260F0428|nr:hypothetical protein [uncultured Kocuria sp.]
MGDNATIETIFGLIFLLPYLIGPALLAALIAVAAPIWRGRRPVGNQRRIASILLVLLSLFWAVQLIGWAMDLGVYGPALMIGLFTASVFTLVRLYQAPAADPTP